MSRSDIAIVGMSCRLPGADDVDAYWRNLRDGVESIADLSDRELLESGVAPSLLANPHYVKRSPILSDIAGFDAEFFEIASSEAELMDPQQRLFLEQAHAALESAGYGKRGEGACVGVYGGCSSSTYLIHNLLPNAGKFDGAAAYEAVSLNEKDFLATKTAYKLNLTGPAITVQTACSTSLVAVHLACQALLSGECDMALAGGVCVSVPHLRGYLWQPGMIFSPDGRCRSFSSEAAGTLGGSGVGVVVLKRLEDALPDGDVIHAVIKGSAVNNDGAVKVGYMAPGVAGQSRVISNALAVAEVEPETIGCVEAHGTATPLGDPIEIAALTQAWRHHTQAKRFCAIGSVKSNFGHLDAAAGIAGLIKAVLAVRHGQVPPSLHFEAPNPEIDFRNSPFFVADRLQDWPVKVGPRRAAVSAFGIGGSNAHVILEEAPVSKSVSAGRSARLLVLSAKTTSALDQAAKALENYLDSHPEADPDEIAWTLQNGRAAHAHRLAILCRDGAVPAFEQASRGSIPRTAPKVAFLFTGQGVNYAGVGATLHRSVAPFREAIAACDRTLKPLLGFEVGRALEQGSVPGLERPEVYQPVVFAIEYALAQTWGAWGVAPAAMLGHSLGEYVAACVAGVFTLEDGLALVATRGRLMAQMPAGAMLAVAAGEEKARALIDSTEAPLDLAAVNGPKQCVISGTPEAIRVLAASLLGQGIEFTGLNTSSAFHSRLADAVLPVFAAELRKMRRSRPATPYVSNVTGRWITADEAVSADYWVRHLRQTVRFDDCLKTLLADGSPLCVELGAGRTLTILAKTAGAQAMPSLPGGDELDALLSLLGRLWVAGVEVDWPATWDGRAPRRAALPTYPFQHKPYWIEPARNGAQLSGGARRPLSDWAWLPGWKRGGQTRPGSQEGWRVVGAGDLADTLRTELRRRGIAEGAHGVMIVPSELGELTAFAARFGGRTLAVITAGVHEVTGGETLNPTLASVLGAVPVIAQERPELLCRAIDVTGPKDAAAAIDEALSASEDRVVALRGCHRWLPLYENVNLPDHSGLRRGGAYVLVGASGQLGQALARHLADLWNVRLALISRKPLAAPEGGLSLQADTADAVALKSALDAAYARFGAIDGIFHLAGFTGSGALALLAETDTRFIAAHFAPKVDGVLALERALQGRTPGFVMLFSSLSSVVGGVGFAAYAGANRFLDHFAADRAGKGEWISVAWDGWARPGQNAPELISEAEGMAAIDRLIALRPGPNVLISVADLPPRLKTQRVETARAMPSTLHERPDLNTAFVAPAGELQLKVARVWHELLGIDRIGAKDDFFALGGHSLMAIRAMTKLNAVLGFNLAVNTLFEHPTVESLAAEAARAAESGDSKDLEAMLALVEGMSGQELDSLVGARAGEAVAAERCAAVSTEALLKDRFALSANPSGEELRAKTREFYGSVSRQLNRSIYRDFARFLNVGWADDGSACSSVVEVPARLPNRNCINLVCETVGDWDLTGRRILDVGCGRGGTIDAMATWYRPESLVGIDLTPEAIEFCRSAYQHPNVLFEVGDAQHLPLPDASFDVVTNIESSHNYHDIYAFYAEVRRVLRCGGRFLYTDVLTPEQWRLSREALTAAGYLIELDRDITSNVLLSCRQTAEVHRAAFPAGNDARMLGDFLGAPGSSVNDSMASGAYVYRIMRLEKRR